MTAPSEHAHLQSAMAARVYPQAGPWGRALAWWQHAAGLAHALPLGLAADLGWLLAVPQAAQGNGNGHGHGNGHGTHMLDGSGDPADGYAAFLAAVAATVAVRTAQAVRLGDVAVAALLAHLARGAPVPAAYRIAVRTSPATVAATLANALATGERAAWEPTLPPRDLLAHMQERLETLTAADIRFLHEMGAGVLSVSDMADLRALTDILALPPLHHALLEEVLAFVPSLADTRRGSDMQTYAVDGIGGLTRRGTSFDMVLPSEWAMPEALLYYRYANHELLYYGRERPPQQLPTLLLLVVQGGDAMAGDADALARASTLALAKAARARGADVRVAWFDRTLHAPAGLERPAEVAQFVQTNRRGRAAIAKAVSRVTSHVRALAQEYGRIEVQWIVQVQAGEDEVGAVEEMARRLRETAGSSVLFVCAGRAPASAPPLAGVLASRWAVVGSAALHEAEERARAIGALRGLAKPGERERLKPADPAPRRRPVVVRPAAPPPDPVRAIIDAGEYGEAIEQLEPRARAGDRVAAILLAEVVETAAAPRELRFRAAGILGAVGDPRLLDPATGDNQLMQYAAQETQPSSYNLHPSRSYWCVVEPGPFWFGDDRNEELRQKTLPYRYRIGRYPVTNAEYARFVDAGGYADRQWWTEQGWAYLSPEGERGWWDDAYEGQRITQPRYWDDETWNAPNQPVVGVSWYEAVAYCTWLTAQGLAAGWLAAGEVIRLPTSLEWERAARGTDRRRYPWGDEDPSEEHANYGNHIRKTTPIGCYPQGIAACGALDMAGQVWEWTATYYQHDDDPTPRGDFGTGEGVRIRGGSHYGQVEHLYCGSRDRLYPHSGYNNRGFRLLPPSPKEQ